MDKKVDYEFEELLHRLGSLYRVLPALLIVSTVFSFIGIPSSFSFVYEIFMYVFLYMLIAVTAAFIGIAFYSYADSNSIEELEAKRFPITQYFCDSGMIMWFTYGRLCQPGFLILGIVASIFLANPINFIVTGVCALCLMIGHVGTEIYFLSRRTYLRVTNDGR